MNDKDFVKFLGTAGARFVMARQVRYSAGTLIRLKGKSLMLDPGPGTLVRCALARPKIDAARLDAILLTHAHIDHSGDVNVLIDAMTAGGLERRGALFAPAECLDGPNRIVLSYLREFPEKVVPLAPERDYAFDAVAFSTSVRHRHAVETYGVKFHRDAGDLAFLVDTDYFDGLAEAYAGADVLVINVVLHEEHKSGAVQHLTAAQAEQVIRDVAPRKAVLTHFGMTMIKAKPRELAQAMSDRLGVEVLAASDGMTVELD